MHLKRTVMLELQKCEMEGKTIIPDAPSGNAAFNNLNWHQQETLYIEPEFFDHWNIAVGPEVALLAVSKHHEPMIERATKDMLAHTAPMALRHRRFYVRAFERSLHLRHGSVHQARISIRSVAFIGHPERPHVAFFKDMNAQPKCIGTRNSLGMHRARVAIEHGVSDAFWGDKRIKCVVPILQSTAKWDVGRGLKPESVTASIKAQTSHTSPCTMKHTPQALKERTVWSLKKKKQDFSPLRCS